MKNLIIIAMSIALASVAHGYSAIVVNEGRTAVPSVCRIVAAEAVSTNKSGSAALSVVKSVKQEWDTVSISTNTTYTQENVSRTYNATNIQESLLVSDGFRHVTVNTPFSFSTNYVGVGTNVLTVSTNLVAIYCTTNAEPLTWTITTNRWYTPTRVWSVVTHTNKTPVITRTHHVGSLVYTNSLGTVTCSGGYGVKTNMSLFVKSGDVIIGSGTAFKGGKVVIFAE